MTLNTDIVSRLAAFFNEAIHSLRDGLVFFGGPRNIIRYTFDILLVTLFIYYILRILQDTRAWQLVKGLVWVFIAYIACNIFQMELMIYLFNRLSVAMAFIIAVVFQPELRRSLESLGLRSFSSSSLSSAIAPMEEQEQTYTTRIIDQVIDACIKMAKSYTGALIVFERTSKLTDLVEQEHAVILDSSVTSTMLQSVFYKGSPLHDGALIIQNGRISAARCHIPLSENVDLQDGLGTRHRAALGASEYGDAVALAVSEERGSISLALGGVLYPMRSIDELKQNLLFLFGVTDTRHQSLGKRLKDRYRNTREEKKAAKSTVVSAESAGDVPVAIWKERKKTRRKISPIQRILLFLLSFVFAASFWVYIQVYTNPVVYGKSITLTLKFENQDILDEQGLSINYPFTTVTTQIAGRQRDLDRIPADANEDFMAVIDFSNMPPGGFEPEPYEFPIIIRQLDNSYYCRIDPAIPDSIDITIYRTASE